MPAVSSATTLLALDAVAVDSETTALDPKQARIVEIAAVRLRHGRVAPEDNFRRLVQPGIPIPAAVTKVHGIDDAAVASAPVFAEIWPPWTAFVRDSLWVGHSLGFDLAILKRECERASLPWTQPHVLDTRLLAELAEPDLAGSALDTVAAWLNVEVNGRHSALGDAITTARIFQALVPKLRERGIRTVGEAMQACRGMTTALEEQHRAGWLPPVEPPDRIDAERELRRIDAYPYRHRVREVMRSPPEFIDPAASVREALGALTERQVSSLYVSDIGTGSSRATQTGIVTERDVLRALAKDGPRALDFPVDRIASRPLATVSAEDFVYRAVARMSRLKFRHLGVTDHGRIVGALSARDLLRLRAAEAVSLGDEIAQAHDVHALAAAWAKLPQVAASLIAEEIGGRDIAAVISQELRALTRAASEIAINCMSESGRGDPPCAFAVAVLGSAGRGESLLALDQDNALVFAEGAPGGREDQWFAEFATHIADILNEVGVPYCKGGVMAKNADWRGSVATWEARIAHWIARSRPEDLLAVDIFFDLRPVSGEAELADRLWRAGFAAARGNAGFAKLLADSAGAVEPGIGFFGRFRTDKGRIDLKRAGLFGIVSAIRALAICHHVVERSTPARLAGVRAASPGAEIMLDALDEAQGVFLDLMVAQQVEDIGAGIPPSNAVAVKRLTRREQDRLRAAFATVRHLDELTRDLLFKD